MTYLDLIKRFWTIHDNVVFSPHEIALYFYLLRECNRQRWPSPFVFANRNICMGLSISESTLIRCRDRLVSNGVFGFKSEKDKRKPPAYYLHDYLQNESRDDSSYLQSESRDDSSYFHGYLQNESRDESSRASSNKDNKTKRHNIPPYNPPKGGGVVDGVLDFGKEPKKKKSSTKPQEPPPPPTLEDVKVYFLSQCADKRLDDWETEAEIFYNNFTATDWVDANGRRIKRWDSRANRWILEKEQKQKQSQTNGTQRKANIQTDRRGTDADGKAEKNWDEAF